jgi:UMF1 family MFS transporter
MRTHDRPRSILSWALYDWANSAFITTVTAGFFPIFFKEYWSRGPDTTVSTARLALANSISGILIALAAPLLGAIADKGTVRKRFLIFFAYLGVVMTMGLSLVAEGHWALAILLYVLALVGFSGGNIFYDALLTCVASPKRMDTVSALGYGLGYLGGGILFAINVWMTLRPDTFGLTSTEEAVKRSFVMVGVWWGVFSIPLLLFVKEPATTRGARTGNLLTSGWGQLTQTFSHIRALKPIFVFLGAYWLYIDGVDTIVRMAVDYGMSIGFQSKDLITALLLTQFVGFPAAILFGRLGARVGAKRAIFLAIGVYILVCFWGAFMRQRHEFYALAVVIGLVQGGVQALSRSYYAKLIPADKAAEFFGFYNMIGKFAVVIGPVLMGGFGLFARRLGCDAVLAARVSISSVALLFVAGGALLWFVPESRSTEP